MLRDYFRHRGGGIADGAVDFGNSSSLCACRSSRGHPIRISWLDAIGVGLTNLGYILALAGLMAEHFGALGLVRRWQVFLAATLVWLTGMILVNVQLSTA